MNNQQAMQTMIMYKNTLFNEVEISEAEIIMALQQGGMAGVIFDSEEDILAALQSEDEDMRTRAELAAAYEGYFKRLYGRRMPDVYDDKAMLDWGHGRIESF